MELFAALAATWPAAETRRVGPWTLRRGDGGGNRVSAATLDGARSEGAMLDGAMLDGAMGSLAQAEAAMRAWGQRPLFMLRPGEEALDAALDATGYLLRDRTRFLAAPAPALASVAAGEAAIACAAPLAVMREIWAAGGVGPARLAVMERCAGTRTWLLGRSGDRPVGCGFVAVHRGIAMLHALEIAPAARRRGLGRALTGAAADWARRQGAATLALAVTDANQAAQALYRGLGMEEAGDYHYHYRAAPADPPAGGERA